MNWEEISKELLSLLGGKSNIKSNMACMTRLRVGVKDVTKVDVDAIKQVEGVMGVVESDTIQIVFGPGKVNKVLEAFSALTGIKGEVTYEDVTDVAKENKAAQKAKYDKPVQNFLKRIANIFVPLLPGIIAAGLINGLINVINVSSGGALSGVWWYECIHTMGWALFAYLPIFAGYNAAREFGGSPILGGIAGAMCIANAAMPLLAGYGEKAVQITLPMTGAVYNPAGGGLIAALIAGVFFAFLEKKIRKVMPSLIDTFISPYSVHL